MFLVNSECARTHYADLITSTSTFIGPLPWQVRTAAWGVNIPANLIYRQLFILLETDPGDYFGAIRWRLGGRLVLETPMIFSLPGGPIVGANRVRQESFAQVPPPPDPVMEIEDLTGFRFTRHGIKTTIQADQVEAIFFPGTNATILNVGAIACLSCNKEKPNGLRRI